MHNRIIQLPQLAVVGTQMAETRQYWQVRKIARRTCGRAAGLGTGISIGGVAGITVGERLRRSAGELGGVSGTMTLSAKTAS